MVRAKLEENEVEIEFTGSLPGVKAEMAFLIKKYREKLEDKYDKEKAESIYEETFELSHKSGEEIRENFERDFIRGLREMLGAKND